MADKFVYVNLDLNGQEIKNVKAEALSSAPTASAGRMYYDTTSGLFGVYDDVAAEWKYIGSGAVDSVNSQTGVVVLDADDIDDTSTTNKFTTASDISKLAGIEAGADVTDATNVAAAGATMDSDTSLAGNGYFLDEDNMVSDDATKVPSQQSVKAYVDTGLAGKIGTSLTSANIIVGNGSNVAAAVAMSGEATIANTGAVTLANSAVIGKVLTGFTSGAGSVASTDTILEAIEKLDGNVNALESSVVLKGTWDASAGTFPGSGSAQAGWSYIVSVAGTVDSVDFAVNDRIVAITDNASTTTYASNWFKLDYTDQVLSVNGQTGAVSLDAGDIAAVTDKNYVTDAQLVVIGNTSGTNTGDQVAGDGLSGTSTLSVNVDDSTIEINADSLRVKDSGITNAKLAGSITYDKLATSYVANFVSGSFSSGVLTIAAATHGLGASADLDVTVKNSSSVDVTDGVIVTTAGSGDVTITVNTGLEFNGRILIKRIA